MNNCLLFAAVIPILLICNSTSAMKGAFLMSFMKSRSMALQASTSQSLLYDTAAAKGALTRCNTRAHSSMTLRASSSQSQRQSLNSPPLVYDERYSCNWPDDHRFPMRKFRDLKALIDARLEISEPYHSPPADLMDRHNVELLEMIHRVHCADYTARFLHGGLSEIEKRRIGLFNLPESFSSEDSEGDMLINRTLSELAGTVHTTRLALCPFNKHRMALNLAGGTHHAHSDFGSGFCILNDLAVAAAAAVEDETNGVNRVLIFDTDVHQGDGTAAIFSTGKYSSSVYTCSIHCEENFPFRKSVSDLDVGLAAGTQDEEYLQVLAATFERAVEESRPDLVLYDAGVDVAASDRLGHLDLSDRGIYLRDRYVLQSCQDRHIPVAAVVGGGYFEPLKGPLSLAARHSLVLRAGIDIVRGIEM